MRVGAVVKYHCPFFKQTNAKEREGSCLYISIHLKLFYFIGITQTQQTEQSLYLRGGKQVLSVLVFQLFCTSVTFQYRKWGLVSFKNSLGRVCCSLLSAQGFQIKSDL